MLLRRLTIFAIDPGISTGWARGSLDLVEFRKIGGDVERLVESGAMSWEAGEDLALSGDPYRMDRHELYAAERASAARLWGLMEGGPGTGANLGDLASPADRLVIEDFTVYGGKANEVSAGGAVPLAPVRVGSMLAFAAELAVMDVTYQMASMAKTTVTNERLKRWGLWTKGSEHARDATRHLVTYVRRLA